MDLLPSLGIGTLGYAFLGGFLPPLVWLYFLLKEDERCPEPLPLLLIAFVAGMLAVPLALPLQTIVRDHAYLAYHGCAAYMPLCVPIILGWSVIEETLKYAVAALLVLWRKDVDEPIDLVIYMLTVALGFAALENALFLLGLLIEGGGIMDSLMLGNGRFIGSNLLHVIASSAIGFALAFSFNFPKLLRALCAAAGLILAIALHAVFNFFIIQGDGAYLYAFLIVWTAAVVFFALFEALRYFRYRNLPKNTC